MQIIPLTRLTWSEERGEYIEMDSYGYQVLAKDGRVLATGESREEAMLAASKFILLPKTVSNVAQV